MAAASWEDLGLTYVSDKPCQPRAAADKAGQRVPEQSWDCPGETALPFNQNLPSTTGHRLTWHLGALGAGWRGRKGNRGAPKPWWQGVFCEKLPQASPMSRGDSGSWLQEEPTAGQSQNHQHWWQHLWNNAVKKRKELLHRERIENMQEKQPCSHQISAGQGGARGSRAEVPLEHVVKITTRWQVSRRSIQYRAHERTESL